MQRRAMLGILTAALGASVGAGGCQVIAQLNVLQVGTGGSGGGSSSSSGTTSSSSSGTTSSSTSSSSSSSAGGVVCNGTQCKPKELCTMMKTTCEPCGMAPGGFPCMTDGGAPPMDGGMPCTSCAGDGTCIIDCTAGNCPHDLTVGPVPTKVLCGGSCGSAMNVHCAGPNPCDVECGMGGCANLQMYCSQDGPCSLHCDMMGCPMAVMHCGDNSCSTTYYQPPGVPAAPVTQMNCDAGPCGCLPTNLSP